MSFPNEDAQYLTATAESGMLVIHSVPTTLSWIPLDVVNRVYNVGGTVTVGTFESVDAAKQAAAERYAVCIGSWQITGVLPLDSSDLNKTENHTPEIDGHSLLRHGIRWK